MQEYFSTLKQQANARAKESTLSILGISNPSLRNHLSELMDTTEKFVNGPVFEQTFAWERDKPNMKDLVAEKLLSQKLVDALDSEDNGRYAFKAEWKPFKHQLQSWKDLLDPKPQSRIITSGTGSGKTECFMVPVLEDLYKQSVAEQTSLSGVHALFLYPLNALINSQKERLNAWTQHFGTDIRFCLFNGNTPNDPNAQLRQQQQKTPNEVLSRKLMRENPAPILVTNGTMLEYMLVRQADAPIIEQSKGKLRWIVLDEAHTYIGSQAAELALQLRRVMQAFEVDAKNVRFVATSATIAGGEAEAHLKKYLAQLAGVDESSVAVIGGERVVPPLENLEQKKYTLDEIKAIDPEGEEPSDKKGIKEQDVSFERYQALCQSNIACEIRDCLTAKDSKPQTASELLNRLQSANLSEDDLFQWIDLCTATKPSANEEAFLKLRGHYFQRMLQGLWCCIDPECSKRENTPLSQNWPFGYVYSINRQKCECGSPVLELTFCQECNEPHLLGRDHNGKLVQWSAKVMDEFSLQDESEREFEEEREKKLPDPTKDLPAIFSAKSNVETGYQDVLISRFGQLEYHGADPIKLAQIKNDSEHCSDCGFSGRGRGGRALRRALLGAPFYTANVVPTILEYCPDIEHNKDIKFGPSNVPGRGRRLITFTDSRQGTARMSIRMQQEAERSRLRGLVVKNLKQAIEYKDAIAPELLEKVKDFLSMPEAALENLIPSLRSTLPDIASSLELLVKARKSGEKEVIPSSISWTEIVENISSDNDVKSSMLFENKRLSPEVFGASDGQQKLVNMLLTREFARRPKRQNNLETQGLVKTVYPELNEILKSPELWEEYGFSLQDWKDFLKVSVDFYIRENTMLDINEDWRKWIGMHFAPKTLLSPDSKEQEDQRTKRWPQVKKNKKAQQRLVNLLRTAAKLDTTRSRDCDLINDWLKEAWEVLKKAKILQDVTADKLYSLSLKRLSFSLVSEAYICPITNKLLDVTFRGLTPYLPRNPGMKDIYCKKVKLPSVWDFNGNDKGYEKSIAEIREKVSNSPEVSMLREQNLWTDINDRAVEGGSYYVTAEHSAQQSAKRLDDYEKKFKEGKKNVLNCSTTMEMGVDIGGITAVVMNNVPPHPANYLQRAGRAGRSKESRALGYTLCKGNPHDMLVFNQPKWAFITAIPAPYVELSSAKLVQRHVNSFLLSKFLNNEVGETDREKINLTLEWFYFSEGDSIAERFINWLRYLPKAYYAAVEKLTYGTALQGRQALQLSNAAADKISDLKISWETEYKYIEKEIAGAEKDGPYEHKLKREASRLCREYLLRELATKAFLPGYGFPTDVVSIDTDNVLDFRRQQQAKDKREREDNASLLRGMPSRNLSVAIREYAPGSDIVIDGRVHRSAGISLNWQKIHLQDAKDDQKFDIAWRCSECGQTGYESNLSQQTEICCDNEACGASIPNYPKYQRRVIQPTGFVTDFYKEPSNNIVHQSYVPVQPAWVSAKGAHISLPISEMGYMVSDHNGRVFQHSAGLNDNGFALCMTCGKAESMTAGGADGNGDFPKALNLIESHYPPRPSKFDKDEDGKREYCQGSAKLLKNVHIGSHTRTDVFELALRHPNTGEYIPDSEKGRIIATTLAVALRSALASTLGVSVNEIQYNVRPAIVGEDNKVFLLQLFDNVSGGAGFATSAPLHIEKILSQMLKVLDCDCDDYCPRCLLEQDSRHDIDNLNRHLAIKWLGESFGSYVKLEEKYSRLLSDGKYCPMTLSQKMTELLSQSPSQVSFVLSLNIEQWDISIKPIKNRLHAILATGTNVTLVVPKIEYSEEVQQFLIELKNMGVELSSTSEIKPIVIQALFEDKAITLANLSDCCRALGKNWLESETITVVSESEPPLQLDELDTSSWFDKSSSLDTKVFEITNEFNGKVSEFGRKFLESDALNSLLKGIFEGKTLKSVHYSDRYLQAPSAIILVTEILRSLTEYGVSSITIDTLFNDKPTAGRFISHDWQSPNDYLDVVENWIKCRTEIEPEVNLVYERREIPHRRLLTLGFESGERVEIRLDQGVGYWNLNCTKGRHFFNFQKSAGEQLDAIKDVLNSSTISNSADWPTDISISAVG